MRSGLVQLGAWTAATGAAVALSWLGVHAVLVDTVFEQPVAVPLPVAASSRTEATTPSPSPTMAPPSTTASAPSADQPSGTTPPSKSAAAARRSASPPSTVQSYPVPGGRVALDVRPTEAKLVSATPEAGWAMQVWHGDQWMRVDFSKDDRVSTVYVTWNGHEPAVQTFVTS